MEVDVGSPINAIAFGPSDNLIVIGGPDGTLATWDIQKCQLTNLIIHTEKAGEEALFYTKSLLVNEKQDIVAINLEDTGHGVALRKAFEELKERRSVDEHSSKPIFGPLIARITELKSSTIEAALGGARWNALETIGFSDQGNTALCLDHDKIVAFRLDQGSETARTLIDGEESISCAATSINGEFVVMASANELRLLKTINIEELQRWNGSLSDVTRCAVCSRGQHVACGFRSGEIRVWTNEANIPHKGTVLSIHSGYVDELKFFGDGRLLSEDSVGHCVVWNLYRPYSFCEVESVGAADEEFHQHEPRSGDGSAAFVEYGTGRIACVEVKNRNNVIWGPIKEDAYASREIAVSCDFRLLASGSWDGLRLYRIVESGLEVELIGHISVGRVNALAFDPKDGNSLFVATHEGELMKLTLEGKELKQDIFVNKEEFFSELAVSPDGCYLAVSGEDNLLLWNTQSSSLVCAMSFPSIERMEFSGERELLIRGSDSAWRCNLTAQNLTKCARTLVNRRMQVGEKQRFLFGSVNEGRTNLEVNGVAKRDSAVKLRARKRVE